MYRAALIAFVFSFLVGCAQTRTITVNTKPADAMIWIDGAPRGQGPITEQFVFNTPADIHRVTASRLGFDDTSEKITSDGTSKELTIQLKVRSRRIYITADPPALISIDGKLIGSEPTNATTADLEFPVDAKNNSIKHTLTAERPNFRSVQRDVKWDDIEPTYNLKLDPMKKNLNITTNPPGANVFLDGQPLGISPLKDVPAEFTYDINTNEFVSRKLRVEKTGYDPTEMDITWDNGKTDYQIDPTIKTKQIRVITDPPGATVTMDGKVMPPDKSGMTIFTLPFPPINDSGDLKTYSATVTMKTDDSEYEPKPIGFAWENGRSDYQVTLKEILTRPVQLLMPDIERTDNSWSILPKWVGTIGMKDVGEGPRHTPPQRITKLEKGTQLGSLTVSPDGTQILYTTLLSNNANDLRSQMFSVHSDGVGGTEILTDGKSLDVMPSYSPGGDQILFSSNRAGRRMSIWSMSAVGAPGITRLTSSDTNDLWPTMDSDPKPRLFYQAMVDTRPDPRLFMTQINTIFQKDLMPNFAGMQPRVSPKNDAIVFVAVNEKTGKRDIYKVSDEGGEPVNLTNSLDSDDFDPNWSKDGSKIVFVSDRAADEEGRHNFNLFLLDLSKPDKPQQLTFNSSQDDCPVFDVTGNSIFFRSNRGGQWNIWRISIK